MKQLAILTLCFLASCSSSGDDTAPAENTDLTNEVVFVVSTHSAFIKANQTMNTLCNKTADAFQALQSDPHAVIDTGTLHQLLDSAKTMSQLSGQAFAEQDSTTGDFLVVKNKGLECAALSDSIYTRLSGALDIMGSKSGERLAKSADLISTGMLRKLLRTYRECEAGYQGLKDKYHYQELSPEETEKL